LQLKLAFVIERIDDQPQLFPDFTRRPSLIGHGFFFGWADVCFGCSGVGVGLCSRTIFPSQEMYAPVISSRSFFRLNSISATLCSKVLCSSGICSFLSELPYYREVDSLLRAPVPSRSQIAPPTTRPTRQRPNSQGSPQNERSVSTRSSSMITLNSNCTHSAMGPFVF